jgi:tight adherence protein C
VESIITSPYTPAAASVVFGIGVLLVVLGAALRRSEQSVAALAEAAVGVEHVRALPDVEGSFHSRVIRPVLQRIANFFARFFPERRIREMHREIERAGLTISVSDLLGLKGILGVLVAGWVALILFVTETFSRLFPLALGLGVLAYYLPDFWVRQRARVRRTAIWKALPDLLDLVMVCVDAGSGFDAAVRRITRGRSDPLALELRRALDQISLGASRKEAFVEFAERTQLDEVRNLVLSVLQSEELGTPISRVLHLHADRIRERRRERASAAAQRAPLKMLFPMVFLTFPSLFIVILAPAGLQILHALSAIH